MDDVGISLDRRLGKAHLELLVAAYNISEKNFVVHKFHAKIELL